MQGRDVGERVAIVTECGIEFVDRESPDIAHFSATVVCHLHEAILSQ